MDTLLTHRSQIREPIHHKFQANTNSNSISKLRIDILSKVVPNFNLNLNHKRLVLPSPIFILTAALILILVLIIHIASVLRKMHLRTVILSQDFRIPRLPITLYHIFTRNLSSQMPISRGRHIRMYRMYRACRQYRSTVIKDAVIHKNQPQGYKLLLANQVLHRDGRAQRHHRSKADCSKSHWSNLSFVDTVIA